MRGQERVMAIRNELIDELLAGRDPSSVMRQDGLLGALKQALLNRLMAAEFDHHMDQERASGEGRNHRNGATRKRVLFAIGLFIGASICISTYGCCTRA